uniref:TATA box-binding protein-associated factor RNA polymerase I subunit D n=1 Tax=Chelydra serpentina TaxID=8475 RepID=A0A8C3S772_CHESE
KQIINHLLLFCYHSDLSDSTGSLFQPECNITLSAGSSTRHLAKSLANTLDRDTSTDSLTDSSPDPGSPFIQAHQRCKEKPKEREKRYKSTGKPRGRPRLTAPKEEQKKRLLDRGFQFPFVEKEYGRKHLPMKMIFEYEQAALKGYFQYIKMLKYEEHLKKALTNLNANEDLENECMEMRKHKYLDDEGPISPIQETKTAPRQHRNSSSRAEEALSTGEPACCRVDRGKYFLNRSKIFDFSYVVHVAEVAYLRSILSPHTPLVWTSPKSHCCARPLSTVHVSIRLDL